MRLLISIALFTICVDAISQSFRRKSDSPVDTLFNHVNLPRKVFSVFSDTNIDTQVLYTDSAGGVVIIQNSLRRAGGSLDDSGAKGYTRPTGEYFIYAVFFTRIVNETAAPLTLALNFPADSFAISPGTYFKIFLPSDTMTLGDVYVYNYGATGLKPFFDRDFNRPTALQRTINPHEPLLFYTAALVHQATGIQQAGFFMEGKDLFYKITVVGRPDPVIVRAGKLF